MVPNTNGKSPVYGNNNILKAVTVTAVVNPCTSLVLCMEHVWRVSSEIPLTRGKGCAPRVEMVGTASG